MYNLISHILSPVSQLSANSVRILEFRSYKHGGSKLFVNLYEISGSHILKDDNFQNFLDSPIVAYIDNIHYKFLSFVSYRYVKTS
jgi:hypothetical protein